MSTPKLSARHLREADQVAKVAMQNRAKRAKEDLPPEPGQPGSPFAPGWTLDRREQIRTLQTLLNELMTLNHGSGAIERLQRCIALAEELRADDLTTCRSSFPQFLIERATNKPTTT